MYKLKQLAIKYTTGKTTLIFFIAANIIYIIMLSITIPKLTSISGDLKILDMLPMGYDVAYVKTLFETLGDEGRNYYLFRQLPLDMIYPALFAISYFMIMVYFLKKLKRLDTSYFYLCLLPLIAGIADYLENFGIIMLLKSHPNITKTLVTATSTFSMIKSTSTTLYFIGLTVVLIVLAYKKIFRKEPSQS